VTKLQTYTSSSMIIHVHAAVHGALDDPVGKNVVDVARTCTDFKANVRRMRSVRPVFLEASTCMAAHMYVYCTVHWGQAARVLFRS
jgi:hypothetical protein